VPQKMVVVAVILEFLFCNSRGEICLLHKLETGCFQDV